jgi:serine protease Do
MRPRSTRSVTGLFSMSLACLAASGVLSAEDAPQLSDVADQVSAGVVSVEADKIDTGPAAEQDGDTSFGKSNTRHATGLVLSADGLIVTATPVVEKVGKITVTFADGRQAAAQIVGRDPATGVALLKETSVSGLKPVQFGDANLLRRGTSVFSIGNVYGLRQSLSSGVIAAIRPSNVSHLILQADLVVRPGSLGAPLFNMKGEVVGMFTSRYAVDGKRTGVGLAVSSILIRHVADKLQKFGTVDRGWLGLLTRKPTDEEARALGLGLGKGVIVRKADGKLITAGLAPGDAIELFNGEPAGDPATLGWRITSSAPNTEVTFGVARKSGRSTVRVRLDKMPEAPPSTTSASTASPSPSPLPSPSDKNANCLHYIPTAGMTVTVPCEE